MRFEIGHLAVLIERVRLEVQTRGIDMRRADVRAFIQRTPADDGEDHALFMVVAVDLVAGSELHAGNQRLKPDFLGFRDCPLHRLAFHLAGADKIDIVPAIGLHRRQIRRADAVIAVLRRRKHLPAQGFVFVVHMKNSFQKLFALLLKRFRRTVILQGISRHFRKLRIRPLRADARLGIRAGDALPSHQASDAQFPQRGNRDRHVAQLRQSAFKQRDCVDRSNPAAVFLRRLQTPLYLAAHRAMRNRIQVAQSGFVGKNRTPELFAIQTILRSRGGKAGGNGRLQRLIRAQQFMIQGVAVYGRPAAPFDKAKKRCLAAARAAGDTENSHFSASASTT